MLPAAGLGSPLGSREFWRVFAGRQNHDVVDQTADRF